MVTLARLLRLRKAADLRTLCYLAAAIAVLVGQWRWGFHPVSYGLCLFLAVSVAVIAHNHNHTPMFAAHGPNLVAGWVISVFYGHPSFVWVPVHNQNHHKFENGPGDESITYRWFRGNHLLALLTYPTLSSFHEMKTVGPYLRRLWERNRPGFWSAVSQYVVFAVVVVGLLVLDWRKALIYVVIPQQFALFVIHVFNYVQHVECEIGSKYDHSRNFVGPLLNALLFNNGFHTVHHLMPGVHWSETPALHAAHLDRIDPRLNERSWWGYMIRTYLLRPFLRPLRAGLS